MKSLKFRRICANALIYFILSLMALIWVAPILWIIMQSFAGEGLGAQAKIIPSQWTFDNYTKLFANITQGLTPGSDSKGYGGYFTQWFLNTLIIAICTTIISTLFTLGTAYALSRFRFNGRQLFMKINLIIGMFPGFLGMIIMYWVMKEIFHLQGNYWAMVIIYSAGAGGGYYISKGFFDTVSKSIDEAAMIDGANRAQIFWSIVLPLAKPIVIYTILTAFMGPWGEYIASSYIIGLTSKENFTVAMGLYKMVSDNDLVMVYYGSYAAGSVCVSIPIVALFFWLQKYYVSGITGGAVKG